MANLNLYYKTQLDTKVSLLAEQINSKIDDNILANLKAKIEGKSIENGIVLKIYKLITYDYGLIDGANFMGTTVFPVKYSCLICSPIKNLEIVCVLQNIIKGYLLANNGPVIIAIQFNDIDTQRFEISNGTIIYTKTKKPIQKEDYLKVAIIDIRNNYGEKTIVTMGKLLNLASRDEIKAYDNDQLMIKGGTEDDRKIMI